jgi:hypothetical protein
MTPPLADGERVKVQASGGGWSAPKAELGSLNPPTNTLTNFPADSSGTLNFGFHITSGKSGDRVDLTVTRANGTSATLSIIIAA